MMRHGPSPSPCPGLTSETMGSVAQRNSAAVRAVLALVHAYQRFLSPLLGPHCRFAPSCSHYAAQAVATHGALRGTALAGRRLLRCHPFHPGGHDPVPPARSTSATLVRIGNSDRTAPAAPPTTATLTARSRAGATS